MDILYSFSDTLLKNTGTEHYRYLYSQINYEQRMLAIKGPRGSGKTTLMLQRIKSLSSGEKEKALYITADHHWFYTHSLIETVEDFYRYGGRNIFIDKVHKYPNWSIELKNIYDGLPDMKIVFSASSALKVFEGEADLSRRVIIYDLPGLSFREFLEFSGMGSFEKIEMNEIKENHKALASEISTKIHPLPLFKHYLQFGYLPIFKERKIEEIPLLLNQVTNAVLESDLAMIEDFGAGTAYKIKKLLGIIAESVPFKPNISSISRKMGVSRDSVYNWLANLNNAGLLNFLTAEGKGTSLLQKPDKIFLENTNLSYALKTNPDTGALRETFLLNQLINAGLSVTLPGKGDFLAGGMLIEVGGRNKTATFTKETDDYIIAADDIEIGFGNKVPLWLFGFLY